MAAAASIAKRAQQRLSEAVRLSNVVESRAGKKAHDILTSAYRKSSGVVSKLHATTALMKTTLGGIAEVLKRPSQVSDALLSSYAYQGNQGHSRAIPHARERPRDASQTPAATINGDQVCSIMVLRHMQGFNPKTKLTEHHELPTRAHVKPVGGGGAAARRL